MDSYISFRYLNKKLLDQYKGLVPVEIECSRRHYNGVDYDTYSYSTIVYYLTPTYLMSSRYFYAVSAVEILLVSVCVCALVCTFAADERIGKKRWQEFINKSIKN